MSIEHEICLIALSATPHLHVIMEWPSLPHYVGRVVELCPKRLALHLTQHNGQGLTIPSYIKVWG
jgi:hypothetical protein